MDNLKADAVFEGGGVKGIGLVGALVAAEEAGYIWQNVAGTSAGAIVASLISAGYSAVEIKKILMDADIASFNDKTMMSNIPVIGPIISITSVKGIYKGDKVEQWLKELFKAKGVEKFGDIKTGFKDDRYKYKLNVVASDISQKRLLVLPQDISKYGMDPDNLDISEAVRMSMSIPLYYKPVCIKYKNESEKSKCFIVDGGLLSNFPVWLFDEEGAPSWPTFGFKLVEPVHRAENAEMNTIQYILNIISTMMEAFDERYIETSNFNRTVTIPTMGIGVTEFNLSRERRDLLFKSGYMAGKRFFREWDFSRYVKEFRSN